MPQPFGPRLRAHHCAVAPPFTLISLCAQHRPSATLADRSSPCASAKPTIISYIRPVPPVLPQLVKHAKLMRRTATIDQLNPHRNGRSAITDRVRRLLRPQLPRPPK